MCKTENVYINLVEIGLVVLEIQKAEFGNFLVLVNNTLVCNVCFVFLATDTLLCVLIYFLINMYMHHKNQDT